MASLLETVLVGCLTRSFNHQSPCVKQLHFLVSKSLVFVLHMSLLSELYCVFTVARHRKRDDSKVVRKLQRPGHITEELPRLRDDAGYSKSLLRLSGV